MGASKQWPPWEVTSSLANLRQLRILVEDPKGAGIEPEPLGWLARLLIVRSCGYLEQTVNACAKGYLQAKSGGPVRAFGLSWLVKARNPTPDSLLLLAGRFDDGLRESLAQTLDENDRRLADALSALVSIRNRIAHGENEGTGRDRSLALSSASEAIADWWISSLKPF